MGDSAELGYWVWATEPSETDARIYLPPAIAEWLPVEFDTGALLPELKRPLDVVREIDAPGLLTDSMPFRGTGALLFSSRLRATLASLGVDNIQYFAVNLRDDVERRETADYCVANIVGRVACVDRERSVVEMAPDQPGRVELVETLTIDDAKASGCDLFRLHEDANVIVASARVKRACELAGLTGILFYGARDYDY